MRPLFTLALFLTVVAAPAAAQRVTGRVIDGGTNQRVAYAEIALVDSVGRMARVASSDSAGFFALSVSPGTYRLRASGLGFAVHHSEPIALQPGEVVSIVVRLTPQGIPLKPIEVRARGVDERGRYGFERRMALGKGHFITVDSIRAARPIVVTDLFYNIPGIGVEGVPGSNIYSLYGYKCLVIYRDHMPIPMGTNIKSPGSELRGPLGGNGFPRVKPQIPRIGWQSPNSLKVDWVRGIEVYRDLSEVPNELQTAVRMMDIWPPFQPEPCGMVWIWTGLGW